MTPWEEAAQQKPKLPWEEAKAEAKPPAEDRGVFNALTEGSQAGLMLGFDDELAAGMLAPIDATIDWLSGRGFDMGAAYTRKQKMLDDQKAARREQHPAASLTGELVGGLTLGGNAPSLAANASTTLGKIGTGILEGAGYGAVTGAGEAKPGERLEGAGTGAGIGAIAGGLVGGAGAALARRAGQKMLPAAPTIDELTAQGRGLYEAAKKAGVTVKPEAYDGLAVSLGQAMKDFALDPVLQPKTSAVLQRMAGARGQQLSLPELENFRKMAATVAREAADASDKTAAGQIVSAIDGLMDNPSNFSIGSNDALRSLQEARKVWKTKLKAEVIDDLFYKADLDTTKYTQSGLSQTIVNNFKRLAKDQQKMAMFTPEERTQIISIVQGNPTERALRWLGKLAPRGVVSAAAGTALGSAALGPAGYVLGPAAGQAAAIASDRMAAQGVRQLQDTIQRGSAAQLPALPNWLIPLLPAGLETSMGTGRSLATTPRQ